MIHERSIREIWAGWTGLGALAGAAAIATFDIGPAFAVVLETGILLTFRTAWQLAGRPGDITQ